MRKQNTNKSLRIRYTIPVKSTTRNDTDVDVVKISNLAKFQTVDSQISRGLI